MKGLVTLAEYLSLKEKDMVKQQSPSNSLLQAFFGRKKKHFKQTCVCHCFIYPLQLWPEPFHWTNTA